MEKEMVNMGFKMLILRNIRLSNIRIVTGIMALLLFLLAGIASATPLEEWNRTFGGTRYEKDYANDVKQTADGGYIIAGHTDSALNNSSAWLIKADANGSQQWKKTFGDPGTGMVESQIEFKSVELVSDGGYITAGSTINGGVSDAWLVKTDANGNLLWSKTFGGSNSDYANAVKQTRDDGYILAGQTNSYGSGDTDAWLIKVGTRPETETVIPPGKAAGFEAVLAIMIFLALYTARGKRR